MRGAGCVCFLSVLSSQSPSPKYSLAYFLTVPPFQAPLYERGGGVLSIRSVIPIPLHRNFPWHIFSPFRRSKPPSMRGAGVCYLSVLSFQSPSPKYSLAYFLTVPPFQAPLYERGGGVFFPSLSLRRICQYKKTAVVVCSA